MPISRTLAELEILWETPMSSEQLKSAHRAPRAKIIRRALGLTQEQFAETYRVPQEMLLDWESGAVEPDARALFPRSGRPRAGSGGKGFAEAGRGLKERHRGPKA